MAGCLDDGFGCAHLAARLSQLDGIDELAALVTLVPACVVVRAERTDPLYEAVSQEPAGGFKVLTVMFGTFLMTQL